MLKKLCSAFGVSGCEDDVRDILKDYMTAKCDEMYTDSIGNLICLKKGYTGGKSIMVSAHMDEVGLIVTQISAEGFIKFKTVGGIDPRVLVAKRVVIGKNHLPGVIGAKPAHLIKSTEKEAPQIKDLFIDIGAKDYADAIKYVSIGDYVCYESNYSQLGDNKVKSKALDNRVGCYILTKLAEDSYPYDIYFSFTVQEEVGCRGAAVAAYGVKPDYAVIVEGTTCSDVPGTSNYGFSTRLGNGPAISVLDSGSYSNKNIVKKFIETANKGNIEYQLKKTTKGGNDAAAVHVSDIGVKTGVISVPCRYIHSPVSVASLDDIDRCCRLLNLLLKEEDSWNF